MLTKISETGLRQSPHPPTIIGIMMALDCLIFVAKIKQVTYFSLIVLFYFVQFLYPFKQFQPDKQEAQRATYRAPEYNVPPFWGIGQGGHFCLLNGPKNTNLVEDVEILLPVKFCWIPFSGFRGLSQSEARAAILFFRSTWKTQTW